MTNPAAIAALQERRRKQYAEIVRRQHTLRHWLRLRWRKSRTRRRLRAIRQTLARWRQNAPGPTLLFLGWAVITAGVAEIGAARIVWAISAGLFALGLFGYKPLGIVLWLGLETLKRTPKETREDR